MQIRSHFFAFGKFPHAFNNSDSSWSKNSQLSCNAVKGRPQKTAKALYEEARKELNL